MTEVILKVRQEDGSIKNRNHEIEEIDGYQLTQATEIIQNILELLDTQPALRTMMDNFLEKNKKKKAKATPKTAAEKLAAEQEEEDDTVKILINGYQVLFLHLPSQAYELLSAMADIELDLLKKQKVSNLFPIYNAVLEENDILTLIQLGKQSSEKTKQKFGWAKKVATALGNRR